MRTSKPARHAPHPARWWPLAFAGLGAALVVLALVTTSAERAEAQPAPPATFAGKVVGRPAQDGLYVIARVNSMVCGISETFVIGGEMRYRVHVEAAGQPDHPQCGTPGAEVRFFVEDEYAGSGRWEAGLTVLDLVPGMTPPTPQASPTVPQPTPRPPATGSGGQSEGTATLDRPTKATLGETITVSLQVAVGEGDIAVVGGDEPGALEATACPDSVLTQTVTVTTNMWAAIRFDGADFGSVRETNSGRTLVGFGDADLVPLSIPNTFMWRLRPLRAGAGLSLRYEVVLYYLGADGERHLSKGWACSVNVVEPPTATPTFTPTPTITSTPTPTLTASVTSTAITKTTTPPGGDENGGGDSGGLPWLWVGVAGGVLGFGGLLPLTWFVLLPLLQKRKSPNVFLSYRRGDAAGWVGRIFDHLVAELSDEHVFQDIVDIEGGADWVEELREKVAQCDVLIALIGNRWVGPLADGTRRIDQADDWVRLETARALDRDCVVIPVLVDGMKMDALGTLPDDLSRLRRRNAIEITAVNFDADMARLLRAIRSSRSRRGKSPARTAP